jgi:PAS domain S-box-containing protein
MKFRSFRIPLWFFITGILWSAFNSSVISIAGRYLPHVTPGILRNINDFASVVLVTFLLYLMIKGQNRRLESSEEQYRHLFELNPNPMWIYRTTDLRFVKVNQSAIDLYGYSKEEFLAMDIMGIRPESDHERLLDCLDSLAEHGMNKSGNWRHLKKSGELLYASIVTYDLRFNNEPCRLVMATNITDIILKEEKIKAQNVALHEIAWSNSHEIRRSLCSVMSLAALLKDAVNENERKEYIQLLQQCTQDFDEILNKNNRKVDLLKEN